MRGDRETIPILKGVLLRPHLIDDRLQVIGFDRMNRFTGSHRHVSLHFLPDSIGNGDIPFPLRSILNGVTMWALVPKPMVAARLTGEHVGAIEFAVDNPIQQHFPVSLCLMVT